MMDYCVCGSKVNVLEDLHMWRVSNYRSPHNEPLFFDAPISYDAQIRIGHGQRYGDRGYDFARLEI